MGDALLDLLSREKMEIFGLQREVCLRPCSTPQSVNLWLNPLVLIGILRIAALMSRTDELRLERAFDDPSRRVGFGGFGGFDG